jgi:hypothetical protein
MPAPRAPSIQRLADHLFDGAADPMSVEAIAWLAGSARFRAFAEAHRDKIRKKLRSASDPESRRDVRAELAVAHAMLADPRFELAFEAYGATKGGPDFTVTYRGDRPFNLEVTRPRRIPGASGAGPLLAKMRQLPPSVPNVVLVAIPGDRAGAFDAGAAVRALRTRAEAKDDAFFASRGLAGTSEFNLRHLRLGAVLVFAEDAAGEDRADSWVNRAARIAVPERAIRACLACLRAS